MHGHGAYGDKPSIEGSSRPVGRNFNLEFLPCHRLADNIPEATSGTTKTQRGEAATKWDSPPKLGACPSNTGKKNGRKFFFAHLAHKRRSEHRQGVSIPRKTPTLAFFGLLGQPPESGGEPASLGEQAGWFQNLCCKDFPAAEPPRLAALGTPPNLRGELLVANSFNAATWKRQVSSHFQNALSQVQFPKTVPVFSQKS